MMKQAQCKDVLPDEHLEVPPVYRRRAHAVGRRRADFLEEVRELREEAEEAGFGGDGFGAGALDEGLLSAEHKEGAYSES